MIPVTPRGFKDILPSEARWRESIVTAAQNCMSLWGYAPIETPTLEVGEVLEQGGELSPNLFRLFDVDNELLVLRPDVTLQVARMAASRLADNDLPLRLRYVQPVFREEKSLKAQARQFTQIGVESLGLAGAVADAEVVLLAIDTLAACGLQEFQIYVGTVGVLRLLLDRCLTTQAVDAQWQAAMLAACHQGSVAEIKRLTVAVGLDSKYARVFEELPDINGKGDAIVRCRQLVEPLGLSDGLDQLSATWEILAGVGAERWASIDFSVISAYDYYTGLVFEVYVPGLGVLLGSGGRYDRMMQRFGASAPAAGFALSLEAVMRALLHQGIAITMPETDQPNVVVAGSNAVEAFKQAASMRGKGKAVVIAEDQARAVRTARQKRHPG
ncbi:MAG: ATP phosphoribosyltransferase regulatory subunit [Coriobacteriales bacterium]|jgi:ATP phosphoribosyltransferase regulatory subunit|nr:ATP phosphoribosyltransferase regulatory subunit [Coriobacteriales bacterium]